MSPKLLNILLVALPAVLFYGYLMPYYTGEGGLVWTPEKSIKALQVENVLFSNTLKQTGIIKDAAEKFEKDYNSFDAETKLKISTMLPDTIDPVKLRNEVINIAAKSGVAISGLKVEKDPKGEGNLNFYKVTFGVKTRYATFKTLVESYEKNKRFFLLDTSSISRPKSDDESKTEIQDDVLDFTITFRVYYMK